MADPTGRKTAFPKDGSGPAPADPYAALRYLPEGWQPQRAVLNYDENGGVAYDPDGGVDAPFQWFDSLKGAGFESKYNRMTQGVDEAGKPVVYATLQQPGAHKYDTMTAMYRQNADGRWELANDPMTAPTRQRSSADSYKDAIEKVGTLAALGGAAYLGGTALAGGAAGGGGGIGTLGTIAPSTAAPMASLSTAGLSPVSMSSLGGAAAGGGGMGLTAGNWIQLAGLGLGLYGSKEAGDRADAALAGANAAAEGTLGLSRDQFEWYKNFVAEQKPARDAAEKRAQDVSDAQLEAMRFATNQAKELDAYNKSTFRPIEQRIATEAQAYDTPERRAAAAASAAADVDMSAAATQAATDRALGRAGVTPGSMRALALREDGAAGQAAVRGGAMTKAVRDVEGQGYARMMDAAGLGRGVVGNQATQQQIATTTGNSSVGNSMQSLIPGNTTASNMQSAFGNSMQANSIAGNLYSQAQRAANDEFGMLLGGMTGLGKFIGSKWGT